MRACGPLGTGTQVVHTLVRERIPATAAGDPLPADLEPLIELVRSGRPGEHLARRHERSGTLAFGRPGAESRAELYEKAHRQFDRAADAIHLPDEYRELGCTAACADGEPPGTPRRRRCHDFHRLPRSAHLTVVPTKGGYAL